MSKIDREGLAIVTAEILELGYNRDSLSKAEVRKLAALTATRATLQNGGITLEELRRQDVNDKAREAGLPEVTFEPKQRPREQRMAAWKAVIKAAGPNGLTERRDMNVGNPISQIGSYSALGYFVPTGFMDRIWDALKAHDCLFDEDCVTVERTANGRPFPVPIYDDSSQAATVLAESTQGSEDDIADVDHVTIGAWKYTGGILRVSIEAFQDMNVITVPQLFQKFSLDRLARGIGKDLVTGNGNSKPVGLIPFLHISAAPYVVAAGSSANDGGAGTGVNSIGSADLMGAMTLLDSKYWASPKLRWFMNQTTLLKLLNLSDKNGRPLLGSCIQYVGRTCYIYGVPVAIAPSLDDIGSGKTPIVLMDGSYWLTRLVSADEESIGDPNFGAADTGIQIFKERYADTGQVGLQVFARADGAFLWKSSELNAACPAVMIQSHS